MEVISHSFIKNILGFLILYRQLRSRRSFKWHQFQAGGPILGLRDTNISIQGFDDSKNGVVQYRNDWSKTTASWFYFNIEFQDPKILSSGTLDP